MAHRDLIVIGASAGGVDALKTLVRALPADLPAAVCIVLHLSPHSQSLLPQILSRATGLHALHASDGAPLLPGHIYVAIPDHHLLIEGERIRVMRGPKENRHRPAVDPLFRSAARSRGNRVIGVVLTGSLDDGTAGLHAIKRHGGVAVVQDPNEALYPSMPLSALKEVEIDHSVPLAALGPLLARLAAEDIAAEPPRDAAPALAEEGEIVLRQLDEENGAPSAFSCPSCGGVLWEIREDELVRYRCRVGHAFLPDSMFAEQTDAMEAALWTALKTLEESAALARRMADHARQRGHDLSVSQFEERSRLAEHHAQTIRQVLDGPPLAGDQPDPELEETTGA
ncbi:MAG TPA: chemotaxis protein CheB [Herpetosiphonaceae bacterium]